MYMSAKISLKNAHFLFLIGVQEETTSFIHTINSVINL